MNDLLEFLRPIMAGLEVRDILDILVVAAIVYWLLRMIEGTTAVALLRGIATVFLLGTLVSNLLGLSVLGWLFRHAIPALLVAIPILFQPELRRALEQIGRGRRLSVSASPLMSQRSDEIVAQAVGGLSGRRWGGLIVIERQIPVGEYASSGIRIDAGLSVELLLSIFYPGSPLHDGAVIVRGDRILAAACVLPLADNLETSHEYGLRHRAAMGITAKTDAISIVVSEETGRVAISNRGRLVPGLDEQKLHHILSALSRSSPAERLPQRLRAWVPNSRVS